jgi:5-methylthioribose kinase
MFNEETIGEYVCTLPHLCKLLGVSVGKESASLLKIKEVGDGYINFVYIIENGDKSIVVKQGGDSFRKADLSVPLGRANFGKNN